MKRKSPKSVAKISGKKTTVAGQTFTPPAYGINFVDQQSDSNDATVQRVSESASKETVFASGSNKTGLPDNLKSGIENLSGYSMDDVKVHYNSAKPAGLQAYAYTQGTDIHVASGQEKHLPHEAWHVVQQKQGRVKPTMQMKGEMNINDDAGLEKEADLMGAEAVSSTVQRKDVTNTDRKLQSSDEPLQFKYPTPQATPVFHDANPQNHPEYETYYALMASLGFPGALINQTWTLLLRGFREQDHIQHQLEQLQYGENVVLDPQARNTIRNDNVHFQALAVLMADHLSVGNRPLALWSGGLPLSPYAHQRGYMPLEETPLGMVMNQIEFHSNWELQAPLWNILSTVFVRQQPPAVHVFLRTFEADSVLFRQEVPVIREIFPNIPIFWHAIYTLTDGTMLEINNNLALEERWQGFASEDQCVQALLEFYLENPNNATERGLGTILSNLPPQVSDAI